MLEFHVSADKAVLDLDLDSPAFGNLYENIIIHNSQLNPTSIIYGILPLTQDNQNIYWHSTTTLSGSAADLVILTANDLTIDNVDFRGFSSVCVSDNKFHRDGNKFLVVEDDKHHANNIKFDNCQAINAYFFCNKLTWLNGKVKEKLTIELNGVNRELVIRGIDETRSVIGSLVIPEHAKPQIMRLDNVAIINNFNCEGVETLSIKNVKTGFGVCKLIVDELTDLVDFQNLSTELIIKAEIANISSFISPIGKVYIDVHSFIEFKSDGDGRFAGIELNIDVSSAIEKKITLPYGQAKFDKIIIKGASSFNVSNSIIAEKMELLNCPDVHLSESRIGFLKYQVEQGKISFGGMLEKNTKIDSLWLIGNINAFFEGPSEVFDLDSEGRCSVYIKNDYKGKIIKLNLNLDAKRDQIDSEKDSYFGFYVDNKGDKKVEIGTILAKLNSFNVSGSIKLGQVISQPIDSKYNLIQINVKYLNDISIDGFFAGFDHNIVIDPDTGKISLIQSMDRALTSSQIFADISCQMQSSLSIRAGKGLSFHGNIKIIDGNIELYSLFGILSARGSLTAKKISLLAVEGELDLSGSFNTTSLVTYSKSQTYLQDTIINAEEFLAQTIGRYAQLNSNINTNSTAILSQSNDIMIAASKIKSALLDLNSKKNLTIISSDIESVKHTAEGHNIYVGDSNILSGDNKFQSAQNSNFYISNINGQKIINHAGNDIDITGSNISGRIILNQAGNDLRIINSDVTGKVISNSSGRDIEVRGSSIESNQMVSQSSRNTTIVDSQILAEENLFFKSISHFLSVNSDIYLGQYDKKLFLYNSGKIGQNGNPLARCGFAVKDTEILGILKPRTSNGPSFDTLQYDVVDSSDIDLSIFQELASRNPKSIIIDVNTGVIIGSSLRAKDHQVIIKTKAGVELLPYVLYNAAMLGGGFNDIGIKSVISKIEAGVIDIDGGSYIRNVGALLRANTGSLKADYLTTESFIDLTTSKHTSLNALSLWLTNPKLYKMIVNEQIIPTKLEFSELTQIDLGKGKIDVFYPYTSKKVDLRQRQGDIIIDRDVHFANEVMAIHADQGKIFFGVPKIEEFIKKIWFFEFKKTYQTTKHVNVTGQNLFFQSSSGIELHGTIQTSGSLELNTGGDIKLVADKHNFGKTVKQSIIKADNAYLMGNNIEIIGSIITVKDHLQIVGTSDIKILPIALMSSYQSHLRKTTIKESAIKQVVSEINAGTLNIDAGRSAEFISALIQVEQLNLHAKELKISAAKDIFERQVEFKGKKKWSGGRNSWTSYDHTETVVPTIINAGTQRILVDQDATIEAANIFARQDILMQVGGKLTIKDGYNLHIHNYHKKSYSLCSFGGGGMKFSTSSNFKHLSDKYESQPTIICAEGSFYGIVNGQMHMLGSAIYGKDIHLVVPEGLKLEASQYTDKALTFVNKSGLKVGFYNKGKEEFGVRAGTHIDKEQHKLWEKYINSSELVASNSISIIAKDGDFEQISSGLAAKIIQVEARNWIAKSYDHQIIEKHIKQHLEIGIKLSIKQTVTSTLDKIKMLVNKKGSHTIDHADRVFKAYDTYKSLAALPSSGVTGGLYAYGEASQTQELSRHNIAVDNIISGEMIEANIYNDIRFEGVKMTGKNIDLKATNFIFETSKDKHDYEYNFSHVNIEIDLLNGTNSNLSSSIKDIKATKLINHQNYIKASGNLKITLSGDGAFRGISLSGLNIDMKANNLILASVQDILSEKIKGANLQIGFNQRYDLQGFGGGGESGTNKSAWTNQVGKIIGSNLVNIVVKETLDLAGSLIASAEEDKQGNLTDKGNLKINCGRMIVKTIHDYDKGKTLGMGAYFQVSQTEGEYKQKDTDVSFSYAPVKYQLQDHRQEVKSTIGQGNIHSQQITGDSLNRNVNNQVQITKKEQASFDSVIHRDMITTIFGGKINEKPETEKETIRKELQAQTLLVKLANYFVGIVDTAKQAGKDIIVGGATIVKVLGSEIDIKQLKKNIDQGLDWHLGLKLSSNDLKKIEEYYKKNEAAIQAEIEGGASFEAAENKIKYQAFFENLKQQIKEERERGNSKQASALQTVSLIYSFHYKQEVAAAKNEGRPVKSFEQFSNEINKNHIYNNPEFGEKVHNSLVTTFLETELVTDERYKAATDKKEQAEGKEPKEVKLNNEVVGSENTKTEIIKNSKNQVINSRSQEDNALPIGNYIEDVVEYVNNFLEVISGQPDSVKKLTDDELREAHNLVVNSTKYIFTGTDERGKSVITEYKKRFPNEQGENNLKALEFSLPIGTRVLIEKVTGTKLSEGLIDPTEVIQKRHELPNINKLNSNKIQHVSNKLEVNKVKQPIKEIVELPENHLIKLDSTTNYKSFPKSVEWETPTGTKQTYKIFQRNDIDWDMVRTKGDFKFIGKTNKEAALAGKPPELSNGSIVQLHHIGQNSKGPLVEIDGLVHKESHKTLHGQFGVNKGHPEFPVDHGSKWQSDVKNYWKWRVNNNE